MSLAATSGQAVVTAFCALNISAFVTADDPNSMWTDPDTGDLKSVWHLRGTVEQEMECDVTVSVTYDVKRLEAVEIGKVEFEYNPEAPRTGGSRGRSRAPRSGKRGHGTEGTIRTRC
jgi:hypothetical protein